MMLFSLVTVATCILTSMLPLGMIGFNSARRTRQRAAIMGIRCYDVRIGSLGFAGIIEIEALTGEDLYVGRIRTAGDVSVEGDNAEEGMEGEICLPRRFLPAPRQIAWQIPQYSQRAFEIVVDGLRDFDIELTVSSSEGTLKNRSVKLSFLQSG